MGLSLTKLLSGLLGKKEVKIALVGLDGVGINLETVEYNNISFTVWDFAGQHRYKIDQHLWKHYIRNTQGFIYVVDSTDRDRADEAKDELHTMLNQDELKDVVVLVFANKQDRPNAMNSEEITARLELHSLSQRHWYIEKTCATSGEGLYEGLDWLSSIVVESS